MSLPDDLLPARVRPLLQTKFFAREFFQVFEGVPSTNAQLLALSSQGAPHGAVIVADYQSFGRGRFERTWFSPPGRNLLFSILLRPTAKERGIAGLVLAAGIAVHDVVRRSVERPVRLKWPNDVLVGRKKIAGILCQSFLAEQPAVVVGVGLNVNVAADEFPAELRDTAASLRQVTGRVFDRGRLLAELLLSLEAQYKIWLIDRPALFRAWEERAEIHGAPVRVVEAKETYEATAQGLDDEGRLVVMLNGRSRAVACGDVHLLEV